MKLRQTLAILTGFFAVALLSLGTDVILHGTGVFPPWDKPMSDSLFLVATVYRLIYTVLGGYITARLAPDRPMRHVLILGAVGFIMATVGAVTTWDKGPEFGPKWYPVALVVTALPCTWLGGRLKG